MAITTIVKARTGDRKRGQGATQVQLVQAPTSASCTHDKGISKVGPQSHFRRSKRTSPLAIAKLPTKAATIKTLTDLGTTVDTPLFIILRARRKLSSEATITTSQAARGSSSRRVSTETSEGSSKVRNRDSSSPRHRMPSVKARISKSPQQSRSSFNEAVKRKLRVQANFETSESPKVTKRRSRRLNLSIDTTPIRIYDKIAVRGSLNGELDKRNTPPTLSADIERSSSTMYARSMPLFTTQTLASRSIGSLDHHRPVPQKKRLSPPSLRNARMRHLLQQMDESALGSESNILRDHYCEPPLPVHRPPPPPPSSTTSALPTHKRGAPGGGSNPNSPGRGDYDESRKRRKLEPNIHFQLMRMEPQTIATTARAGCYVVDIVSSITVRQFPLPQATCDIIDAYASAGRQRWTSVGTGPFAQMLPDGECVGIHVNCWAYISRLRISDIGANGRRRTLTGGEMLGMEKSWDVVLVPLREVEAEELRELLEAEERTMEQQEIWWRDLETRMTNT